MKGAISQAGTLLIHRKDTLKETLCPFDRTKTDGESIVCGDWCALFHEPIPRKATTELPICHKILIFTEFQDWR